MSKSNTPLIERLKKQQTRLNARLQVAEARYKVAERKKETQRKILVGSYYLKQASKNNDMDSLKQVMAGFLTRDSDRKLFDLPTLAESANTSSEAALETT